MYRKLAAIAMTINWLCLSCGLGFAHHSVAANFDGSNCEPEEATFERFIPPAK